MIRRLAPIALLLLVCACHRPRADQPAPGADGEAQARTAAKTLADLQAADDASRGPAPAVAPVPAAPERREQRRESAEPADDSSALSDANEAVD